MTRAAQSELLRQLPSLDELLRQQSLANLIQREGRAPVTQAARTVLARLRQEATSGRLDEHGLKLALDAGSIARALERELRQSLAFSLRPLINATGVILHTNLGRAPLGAAAVERIAQVAATYSNLEYEIEKGERGKRDVHAQRLFARLLEQEGAPGTATVVVNNNAAAVLLALNTLAEGGEVVVSRGELVEIGGAFRIPEVMAKAGCLLREVGTTNRTRASDYERAITDKTRLLLRVHRSNFQIVGFTEQPAVEELVALGRSRGIPVMEDLGSGALVDLRALGIPGEPTVAESLRAGLDLVTYSGDKLLGGPQAGLITGHPELVARIRKNPLFRALRVDKLAYAALEATLVAYLRGDHDAVPAVRMMRLSVAEIRTRAEILISAAAANRKLSLELLAGDSVPGGGSAPAATLPTVLVAFTHAELGAEESALRLRHSEPPIIARVEEGRVLLDLRTVFPEQDAAVAAALSRL